MSALGDIPQKIHHPLLVGIHYVDFIPRIFNRALCSVEPFGKATDGVAVSLVLPQGDGMPSHAGIELLPSEVPLVYLLVLIARQIDTRFSG